MCNELVRGKKHAFGAAAAELHNVLATVCLVGPDSIDEQI